MAQALRSDLTGEQSFSQTLAGYEGAHNNAALQGYRNAVVFAALQTPPPDVLTLIRALVIQLEQASRFMGTTLGTVPAEEFLNPENLAAVMAGADVDRRYFDPW